MLTVGKIAIYRSAFIKNMRPAYVTIVREMGGEYCGEASYRVRRSDGTTFCAFAFELTTLD